VGPSENILDLGKGTQNQASGTVCDGRVSQAMCFSYRRNVNTYEASCLHTHGDQTPRSRTANYQDERVRASLVAAYSTREYSLFLLHHLQSHLLHRGSVRVSSSESHSHCFDVAERITVEDSLHRPRTAAKDFPQYGHHRLPVARSTDPSPRRLSVLCDQH